MRCVVRGALDLGEGGWKGMSYRMASTRLNWRAFFRSGCRKCERFFLDFFEAVFWSLRRYLRALADWTAVRDC